MDLAPAWNVNQILSEGIFDNDRNNKERNNKRGNSGCNLLGHIDKKVFKNSENPQNVAQRQDFTMSPLSKGKNFSKVLQIKLDNVGLQTMAFAGVKVLFVHDKKMFQTARAFSTYPHTDEKPRYI